MNLKKILLILSGAITLSSLLIACNGGGGSNSSGGSGGYNGSFSDYPVPRGGPYTESGTYPTNTGVPYSQLGQPTGFTNSYPNSFWPNNLHNALQIAYGHNMESALVNLAGYIVVNNVMTPKGAVSTICSSTPVYYDSVNQRTWFVSAAHCFMQQKQQSNTVVSSDLWNFNNNPTVLKSGIGGANNILVSQFGSIQAVFVRKDYCKGATFQASSGSSYGSECPNFSPSDGGQGNDISLFYVNGKYPSESTDTNLYPKVVPPESYPHTYSMAPVLSIGYGINTQTPNNNAGCSGSSCGQMFAVANYQYWQQDAVMGADNGGYHYLYNSFYANTVNQSTYGSGYTALICGGDSGGGDLFWTGTNWILLSEHTYGPSDTCGTFYNYLPNGATNVSAYYDWIKSLIHSSNPVNECNSGIISNCATNG